MFDKSYQFPSAKNSQDSYIESTNEKVLMKRDDVETIFHEIEKLDKVSEEIMDSLDKFSPKKKKNKKGKNKKP